MRRIKLIPARIVALGAAVICTGSAGAQATTVASPFHAGQWGIEEYCSRHIDGGRAFPSGSDFTMASVPARDAVLLAAFAERW